MQEVDFQRLLWPQGLKEYPTLACKHCRGELTICQNVGIPSKVTFDNEFFEEVDKFCYFGDMMGNCGVCFDAMILTSKAIFLSSRVGVFNSCVRNALLYVCETWPTTYADTTISSDVTPPLMNGSVGSS